MFEELRALAHPIEMSDDELVKKLDREAIALFNDKYPTEETEQYLKTVRDATRRFCSGMNRNGDPEITEAIVRGVSEALRRAPDDAEIIRVD